MTNEQEQIEIPKKILCGPFCYGVVFDEEDACDYGYDGVTLFRSRRIKLNPRQPITELPHTFLHEVLHALGQSYDILEWKEHKKNDNQENVDNINLMTTALLVFIRSNPEVIAWLQKDQ